MGKKESTEQPESEEKAEPQDGKSRSALAEMSKDGAFKRKASSFRNWVGKDPKYPAEKGRYLLYVSYACPWANRCIAVRNMKGLEDVIDMAVVHPTWQLTKPDTDDHAGWVFKSPEDEPISGPSGMGSFHCKGCIPDPHGRKTIRQVYNETGHTGKYTVPILFDSKTMTIVNNESSEIIVMLNNAFNEFAKNPGLDLAPEKLQVGMDEVDEWIYPTINNGVYQCGFATKQAPYEQAHKELYESLARLETMLEKQKYLVGDQLTLSDIRLFVTLFRFDPVYVIYFKCAGKRMIDYPNILEYCRRVFKEIGPMSFNMDHCRTHYFTSHPSLNKYAIVPKTEDFGKLLLEQA